MSTEEQQQPVAALVLGGLGFIGRHYVKYLLDYGLATHIRVVDKVVASMAYLNREFLEIMNSPAVEYVQANLAVDDHVDRAFAPSEAIPMPFQFVVNLAAETKCGKPEAVYNLNISQLREKCAAKAAAHGVQKYIDVSTAQVYAGKDKPAKEGDKPDPWTLAGKAHLRAEQALPHISGLDYCVLRLPYVYGPGDQNGLMPRIAVAAVYAYSREKMELLWGDDLRLHTVHVQDVAAALYHLICSGTKGEVYNLVDNNDTTQGKLCKTLQAVFSGLQVGYIGSLKSFAATNMQLDDLVDAANDGHFSHWDELCKAGGINYTPLAPWLEKELLYHNHVALDGSKIAATGFECSCPAPTAELLLDEIQYWVGLEKFPAMSVIAEGSTATS